VRLFIKVMRAMRKAKHQDEVFPARYAAADLDRAGSIHRGKEHCCAAIAKRYIEKSLRSGFPAL
jgi:hypothetical protein